MSGRIEDLSSLSDVCPQDRVASLAMRERHATVDLVACLAEYDRRRLYLAAGYSSLFAFCTHALHLSEHAAYTRIEAARAARRFPVLLEELSAGAVTLATICLLSRLLTAENCNELCEAARHKSKREVEQLFAVLRPLPDVASSIRKLAAPRGMAQAPMVAAPPGGAGKSQLESRGSSAIAPTPGASFRTPPASTRLGVPEQLAERPQQARAVVQPLAPERYKLQVTLSRETHDKLRQAQNLLRHAVRDGDPAAILDRALTLLLHDLERRKLAVGRTERNPGARAAKPESRHIPAAVRRAVWARDKGQCAFVGSHGRCRERGYLEFHHLIPFACGGPAEVSNIALRCRAHNIFEAEQDFVPELLPTLQWQVPVGCKAP